MENSEHKIKHFIELRIEADLESKKYGDKVITRFPPEPNGYLHVGHAKAICLDFGMAKQYQGRCHLRFDDTNPTKEDVEYMHAIKEDVNWLGFNWDALFHASDYFQQFYDYANALINKGLAYVCHLNMEQIREHRGTLTTAGRESPYRNRTVAENLTLFKKMHDGEFSEGECVLRAKIDMQSGNVNMRDPVMYRILKTPHPHAGDKWCIYPMYDYAHCLSDAIEGITHSLCTLEFQDHRPLYDWFLQNLRPAPLPQQIEFSRLNLTHTLTSKRKLKALVDEKQVSGWDDPRMPTLCGLRRRGFTPKAIRQFCQQIGITKSDSVINMSVLEECVRNDLNQVAPRVMCVLKPLKITIENYPADKVEKLTVPNHPQQAEMGSRTLSFTREIYIEQDDFMLDPPKKYFRLFPGSEVRLRYGYIIKCEQVITDPNTGAVIELKCSYDPETLGKNPEGRKVKGVIHWVSATHSRSAEVRLYDRLFNHENPGAFDAWEDFIKVLNPHSFQVETACRIESEIIDTAPEARYQFERLGYFVVDRHDSQKDKLVFNRIVNLHDSWAGS